MNSQVLELKSTITYGPVNSRRLGYSLGINVLPQKSKICSYDCLYCQYGLSEAKAESRLSAVRFPEVETILDAVEEKLRAYRGPLHYLTFSGHGEATLHPHFDQLVKGVISIRDRFRQGVKTAILSNSSTVSREKIRHSLALLDEPIMKLDAGDEQMLSTYNRPSNLLILESITGGLAQMKTVIIQTLFTEGTDGNGTDEHIQKWLQRIKVISPQFVQIYTLSRPTASNTICPMSKEKMENICDRLHRLDIKAEVYR